MRTVCGRGIWERGRFVGGRVGMVGGVRGRSAMRPSSFFHDGAHIWKVLAWTLEILRASQ